ncbi:rhomboid family intramembrane serine protease [Virgibacillus ainsalahensis]
MYIDEQFTMYQIAWHLVAENDFEILHINDVYEEIWLEKYGKNTSTVIRLAHKGFDWKNHLQKDMEQVFQKMKQMKGLLVGKNIELHNVYVSFYAPVDDWEQLKKPMQLKEKKNVKAKLYYLDETDATEEKARLLSDVGATPVINRDGFSDLEKEEKIKNYHMYLIAKMNRKQKEVESIFSFGKPIFTYILLMLNIIAFVMFEKNGDSTSVNDLIEFGAKYNPAIIDGQWWRIITSMFIHIGLFHLFMNMLAIYYIGSLVEKIYGSFRFIIIYFLAGIGGGLASFAFTTSVSAGASGALFGMFGALLFFGVIHKKVFFQTMGMNVLILVGINVVFGFAVPQVDNGAHLGGLVAGFIAAGIVHLPHKRKPGMQLLAFLVYIAMIYGLITYGVQNNLQNQSYQLMNMEESLKEEKYEEVAEIATEALEMEGDLDSVLLFQRAFAYIEMNQIELAIEDLEHSIQYDEALPEAYYNLALLYYNEGEDSRAEELIEIAYEKKPEDESFISLYEQITGKNVN